MGISAFALLAAPQPTKLAPNKVRLAPKVQVLNAPGPTLRKPAVRAPRTPSLRPTVQGRRRGTPFRGAQGPGTNPLLVTLNGQVVPAIPMGNNLNPIPAPGAGQWFNLSIFVPATGQDELFILGVPNTPANVDVPLLVGMRQSNASHADITDHTTFWDECLARGWYLLAPLSRGISGFDTNGGSTLNAQINTKAALDWVTQRYPIDSNRIYGVGFSGGGSLVANFAARHLDPTDSMFAAVVIHTGAMDLTDSYRATDPLDRAPIEALMGGSPATIPFEFRRISSVELDAVPSGLWVSGGEHGAWNLGAIPTQIWYATNDTKLVLLHQTTQLFDWMNSNGNSPVSFFPRVSTDVVRNFHSWEILDETQICDWFDMQVLTAPLSGYLLMDRDARFHYFDLQQDTAGAFSRLSFVTTLAQNKLELKGTENVQSLTFRPADLGLFTISGVFLTLDLDAQDSGDLIVLEGLDLAPSSVTRGGLQSPNWSYSGVEKTLTIHELETGLHTWVILFP